MPNKPTWKVRTVACGLSGLEEVGGVNVLYRVSATAGVESMTCVEMQWLAADMGEGVITTAFVNGGHLASDPDMLR